MGYVNRCVCSATKVPGRAANCPDTTVSFLGLGGLSAGERREDRGWERGNWDVPGISLHIWEGGWGGRGGGRWQARSIKSAIHHFF